MEWLLQLTKQEKLWNIVIAVVVTAILIRIVTFVFQRLERSKNNQRHQNTLAYKFLSKVAVVLLIIALACQILTTVTGSNQYIAAILASSGVLTVILGLAAQESLGNVISGFFIMLFKPFAIGDRVTLFQSKITGYIEDITLRHTVVRTYYNSRYTIPNSKMNSEVIENSDLTDSRSGMYLDVIVPIQQDITLALKIMEEIITENPHAVDFRTESEKRQNQPKASVLIRDITIYGASLRGSVWAENVDASFSLMSELRKEVLLRFQQNHIQLTQVSYIHPDVEK